MVSSSARRQFCPFMTQLVLTLSSSHILDPQPPVEDHGAVMVDVKERQLIVLLPQDKEQLFVQRERERWVTARAASHSVMGTVFYLFVPCRWALWPWRRKTTSRLRPSEEITWHKESFTHYNNAKDNNLSLWSANQDTHPHRQGAGAVVYRLAEVAVLWEPGCDQELEEISTVRAGRVRLKVNVLFIWAFVLKLHKKQTS